ncbi:ABC transporter permease [Streptomyces sp. NPDC000405]|uniref:ABC transporter permease n=1 Tax=Streptomyces sp. NPDC000405 TaxID=3161033 RepID=UPI00398D4955
MTDATLAAPERGPDHRAWSARLRDVGFWADWAALVGLVVLVIVFQSANSTFLSVGNIQSMLVAAAILIILAVGQTFVIATAGIDLSIASAMTLGAVAFGQAYQAGWGLGPACLLAVAASAAVGVANGLIVARGKITDFIVTLGALSAASGLALILADGKPVTVVDASLLKLSTGGLGVLGWTFLIAAGVAIAAHVVLFHTRFGTHVLATGGAPESASAMGISTARIKIAAPRPRGRP